MTSKDNLWSTHFIKMRNMYINRLLSANKIKYSTNISNNNNHIIITK